MSTIKSSAEDLTLNADGSNEIKFQINAVEKASINSSGLLTSTTIDATALTGNLPAIDGSNLTGINAIDGTDLTIVTGDIVFGTAGKGICLGVTSNTDGNTLDDYEEGTFTPTMTLGGGATGVVYGVQEGTYTKIGNTVSCIVVFNISDKGSSTGSVYLGGFPFTVANWSGSTAVDGGSATFGSVNTSGALTGVMAGGTTNMWLLGHPGTAVSQHSDIPDDWTVRMSVQYQV